MTETIFYISWIFHIQSNFFDVIYAALVFACRERVCKTKKSFSPNQSLKLQIDASQILDAEP